MAKAKQRPKNIRCWRIFFSRRSSIDRERQVGIFATNKFVFGCPSLPRRILYAWNNFWRGKVCILAYQIAAWFDERKRHSAPRSYMQIDRTTSHRSEPKLSPSTRNFFLLTIVDRCLASQATSYSLGRTPSEKERCPDLVQQSQKMLKWINSFRLPYHKFALRARGSA